MQSMSHAPVVDQKYTNGVNTVSESLLTVNEAAARLSIGRTLLYELISKKELNTIKIGRARRVPESAIQEWISRRMREHEMTGANTP